MHRRRARRAQANSCGVPYKTTQQQLDRHNNTARPRRRAALAPVTRALLGLRTSWLSREIFFFGGFVVVSAWSLSRTDPGPAEVAASLLLGLAALFSMDRVYRYRLRSGLPLPHSAGVLLTGLFAAALLAGETDAVLVVGGIKLLLYAARKIGRMSRGAA